MLSIERNDDGDFDVRCCRCGASNRMHPGESVVPQVEMFLASHACSTSYDDGRTAPPTR